jgi:hypothetical protein
MNKLNKVALSSTYSKNYVNNVNGSNKWFSNFRTSIVTRFDELTPENKMKIHDDIENLKLLQELMFTLSKPSPINPHSHDLNEQLMHILMGRNITLNIRDMNYITNFSISKGISYNFINKLTTIGKASGSLIYKDLFCTHKNSLFGRNESAAKSSDKLIYVISRLEQEQEQEHVNLIKKTFIEACNVFNNLPNQDNDILSNSGLNGKLYTDFLTKPVERNRYSLIVDNATIIDAPQSIKDLACHSENMFYGVFVEYIKGKIIDIEQRTNITLEKNHDDKSETKIEIYNIYNISEVDDRYECVITQPIYIKVSNSNINQFKEFAMITWSYEVNKTTLTEKINEKIHFKPENQQFILKLNDDTQILAFTFEEEWSLETIDIRSNYYLRTDDDFIVKIALLKRIQTNKLIEADTATIKQLIQKENTQEKPNILIINILNNVLELKKTSQEEFDKLLEYFDSSVHNIQ